MGRAFTADDARNGAAPVILISNAWWRRQFNADPNIVGKAFDINGRQTTIIGVLPASFDFGAVFAPGTKVDAITPLNLYGPPRDWGNIITMIGRLKPGVTTAAGVERSGRRRPEAVLELQAAADLRCTIKTPWSPFRSRTMSPAGFTARSLFSGPPSA